MANHGWLPRSGKDISLKDVRDATGHAFNYAPHVFDDPVGAVFTFNLSTTETPDVTFNLDDLGSAAAHDTVEFDASLSRNDFLVTGDALHFDRDVWGPVAENLGLKAEGDNEGVVTVGVAAKARAARVKDAMEVNPAFNASDLQVDGSPGTTGLYLTTLWDDEVGGAPKAWVKAFFGEYYHGVPHFWWYHADMLAEEERIAYHEGFMSPGKAKDGETLGDMVEAVLAVPV